MKIIRKTELDKGFLLDLDDGSELEVSEELYFTRYLYEKEELSEEEIQELLFADRVLGAKVLCKRKLATGPKPGSRLFVYLSEEGYADDTCREAIRQLESEGYLDDMKYARKKIRRKMISSPLSKKSLVLWLAAAGLDNETASRAVEESGIDDLETAVSIAETKSGAGKDKMKIAGYLASRGFGEDIISRVTGLEDLWNV